MSSNDASRKKLEQSQTQLITDILELGGKLVVKYDSEDDQEFAWMRQNCDDPKLLGVLAELSVTMLHVLEAVGQLGPVNGVTISQQFRVSKGGVSKITRRLVALGLVEKTTRPENNKEVYFYLTPLGEAMFTLHRRLHEQLDANALDFFSRYGEADLQVVRRLLSDLLEHPKIAPKLRPEPLKE